MPEFIHVYETLSDVANIFIPIIDDTIMFSSWLSSVHVEQIQQQNR